jgi:uncharacterized protein YegJ (DUF2314 family)
MKDNSENIYQVNYGDKEVLLAMQKARDTFEDFKSEVIQDYSRKIPVLDIILIKAYFYDVNFPNNGEHLWVKDITFEGERIIGEIVSVPEHVKSVESGKKVSILLEQLSDWLYVSNGKAHGAFTVRLLRNRMTPQERQEHDKGYSYSFD